MTVPVIEVFSRAGGATHRRGDFSNYRYMTRHSIMISLREKLTYLVAISLGLLAVSACGVGRESSAARSDSVPAATTILSDEEAVKMSVRFLEERIKRDSEDFISHNKLAAYYLQFLRETGDLNYLTLATRAAKASLSAVPAEMNPTGLAALARTELASHNFISALEYAKQLIQIEPRKGYPFEILTDALHELGEYDKAAAALRQLQRRSDDVSVQVRFGHHALLRGNVTLAQQRFTTALEFELQNDPPSRETVAWIRWQLGEVYFSTGEYATAEKHYRDALITFPDYYRALASLGRVRAALGDFSGAIENYERATRILPDPAFVAALGDLYQLAGREKEAQVQYALLEQIGKLSKASGALYNRQIALFYADHDLKAEEAYAQARLEYGKRRDIYGADALAWTALKAGKITEAQQSIKEALRLGTRDAKLFYHAAMIAKAAGDLDKARDELKRALALNPQFDARQALNAKKTLESLE
jgi:tetratricopeptide (TPR) repeat protein